MKQPQGSEEPTQPGTRAWRGRRLLWPVAQGIITVAVLVWVFADPALLSQMAHTLERAEWRWLLAGLALGGGWLAVGVARWRVFLVVQGVPLSYRRAAAIYLISLFFTLFLPGAAGAGAVRAFYVWREWPGRQTAALLSVILDHLSGFIALVVIALTFTFTRADWFQHSAVTEATLYFLGGFLALSLGGIAFAFVGLQTGLLPLLTRHLPGGKQLLEFTEAMVLFIRVWRASLRGVLLSFVVLPVYFATFYCAARAFGSGVSLADMLTIMPVIDVISALPLTVSGLGVREKLFEELLARLAGVPAATALLISLVGFGFSAAWSLLGGVLFPLYRRGTATPASTGDARPADAGELNPQASTT